MKEEGKRRSDLSTLILVAFIAIVLWQTRFSGPQKPDIEGEKAADFSIPALSGGKLSLADFQGKYVVLSFWASWCGPCRRELPALEAFHRKLAESGHSEIALLGINAGEAREQVRDFVREKGLTFPVGLDADHSVAQAYRVAGLPQTVLIGPDGTIRAVFLGYHARLAHKIEARIEAERKEG